MAGKAVPSLCDKDCMTMLVMGLRGTTEARSAVEKRGRIAAMILHSHIFDMAPTQMKSISKRLEVIVSDSTSQGISQENVKEIQEILYSMPTTGSGISRIIFAHSKGANVAYEAVKDESLLKYLNEKDLYGKEAKDRIRSIRNKLAIFTLGGTQDIPERFGKISINIYLPDDYKAKCVQGILSDNHGEKIAELQFVKGVKEESSKLMKLLLSSTVSVSDSYGLDTYCQNEEIMEKITSILWGWN